MVERAESISVDFVLLMRRLVPCGSTAINAEVRQTRSCHAGHSTCNCIAECIHGRPTGLIAPNGRLQRKLKS